MPLGPLGTAEANLNVMVQQQEMDRAHMLVLKSAIESLHESSEAQRLGLEASERRHDEQGTLNARVFKDFADLRGTCTQHAVRIETSHAELRESLQGQDLVTAVGNVLGPLLEAKVAAISSDMEKVKEIVDVHEKREAGMAKYLDGLMGERPVEGAMIVKSFEHVDAQILQVKADMARQYAESSEAIAVVSAVQMAAGPVTSGGMSAAERAECEGLKLQYTTLAVAVDEINRDDGSVTLATLTCTERMIG